ncbi:hypothetical protein DM02DRAFT_677578 [Periconia macrospinosa]|uniref:Uncharacterized protein n=1 Tax=Periconia macrospinosa TaxID=97972 RepID=A0A2V1D530_9PLEO|nr:hypothetical protein DM02DRAFT_677578 [Periconia macrospinosa]
MASIPLVGCDEDSEVFASDREDGEDAGFSFMKLKLNPSLSVKREAESGGGFSFIGFKPTLAFTPTFHRSRSSTGLASFAQHPEKKATSWSYQQTNKADAAMIMRTDSPCSYQPRVWPRTSHIQSFSRNNPLRLTTKTRNSKRGSNVNDLSGIKTATSPVPPSPSSVSRRSPVPGPVSSIYSPTAGVELQPSVYYGHNSPPSPVLSPHRKSSQTIPPHAALSSTYQYDHSPPSPPSPLYHHQQPQVPPSPLYHHQQPQVPSLPLYHHQQPQPLPPPLFLHQPNEQPLPPSPHFLHPSSPLQNLQRPLQPPYNQMNFPPPIRVPIHPQPPQPPQPVSFSQPPQHPLFRNPQYTTPPQTSHNHNLNSRTTSLSSRISSLSSPISPLHPPPLQPWRPTESALTERTPRACISCGSEQLYALPSMCIEQGEHEYEGSEWSQGYGDEEMGFSFDFSQYGDWSDRAYSGEYADQYANENAHRRMELQREDVLVALGRGNKRNGFVF